VTASAIGPVMLRAIRQATTIASTTARPQKIIMIMRKPSAMRRASAPSAMFLASSRSIRALIDASQSVNTGAAWVRSTSAPRFWLPASLSAITWSTSGRACPSMPWITP
jgi:hypothetical protein